MLFYFFEGKNEQQTTSMVPAFGFTPRSGYARPSGVPPQSGLNKYLVGPIKKSQRGVQNNKSALQCRERSILILHFSAEKGIY
jgi:hypothetical protein